MAGLYDLVDLMLNTLPRRTNQTITNAGADLRAKTAIKQLTTLYNFIDTHYLEPISLDEVANELGFNPQYFSRFFKRNTGETFGQFLTRYRLMKACYLLATDDSPISEIAEQSGFNTDKTFHRVFKRRMGITPRMYRVRIQKNTR